MSKSQKRLAGSWAGETMFLSFTQHFKQPPWALLPCELVQVSSGCRQLLKTLSESPEDTHNQHHDLEMGGLRHKAHRSTGTVSCQRWLVKWETPARRPLSSAQTAACPASFCLQLIQLSSKPRRLVRYAHPQTTCST